MYMVELSINYQNWSESGQWTIDQSVYGPFGSIDEAEKWREALISIIQGEEQKAESNNIEFNTWSLYVLAIKCPEPKEAFEELGDRLLR